MIVNNKLFKNILGELKPPLSEKALQHLNIESQRNIELQGESSVYVKPTALQNVSRLMTHTSWKDSKSRILWSIYFDVITAEQVHNKPKKPLALDFIINNRAYNELSSGTFSIYHCIPYSPVYFYSLAGWSCTQPFLAWRH